MKDLSQYLFIKDLSQYKWQCNTLKGFEICDSILLISESPFCITYFLKMQVVKKLIVLISDYFVIYVWHP